MGTGAAAEGLHQADQVRARDSSGQDSAHSSIIHMTRFQLSDCSADTKFRLSLGSETLCNLLQVRVNTDCECNMFRPTKDLVDKARHATGI